MSAADLERWNTKYASVAVPGQIAPDAWLAEQVEGLEPGRALELACGLGHNAIWLAQQGWQVDAVDVSPLALDRAAQLAKANNVHIRWIASDLDEFVPEAGAYELAIVFRFLDRVRIPAILERAVRQGGRLMYETFTLSHVQRPESHMKNPAFALNPGELPALFPDFQSLAYRECSLPDRDVARLVAKKT